ncbi:MAG: very short patch repair endonuclease [Actinomycetota bacterium]|nr:very short patch repair endonuclease [Actinomycetota bacterium]
MARSSSSPARGPADRGSRDQRRCPSAHVLPRPRRPRRPRANRRRDTTPELALRQALRAVGLRFRVDFAIRPDAGRAIRPDIAFTARRLAVFVDGCFWHGCPEHHRQPRANSEYWSSKIERNRERDSRDAARLRDAGWRVLRFWEHEPVNRCAATVVNDLASHSQPPRPPHRPL